MIKKIILLVVFCGVLLSNETPWSPDRVTNADTVNKIAIQKASIIESSPTSIRNNISNSHTIRELNNPTTTVFDITKDPTDFASVIAETMHEVDRITVAIAKITEIFPREVTEFECGLDFYKKEYCPKALAPARDYDNYCDGESNAQVDTTNSYSPEITYNSFQCPITASYDASRDACVTPVLASTDYYSASSHCSNLGMRIPTASEAQSLSASYNQRIFSTYSWFKVSGGCGGYPRTDWIVTYLGTSGSSLLYKLWCGYIQYRSPRSKYMCIGSAKKVTSTECPADYTKINPNICPTGSTYDSATRKCHTAVQPLATIETATSVCKNKGMQIPTPLIAQMLSTTSDTPIWSNKTWIQYTGGCGKHPFTDWLATYSGTTQVNKLQNIWCTGIHNQHPTANYICVSDLPGGVCSKTTTSTSYNYTCNSCSYPSNTIDQDTYIPEIKNGVSSSPPTDNCKVTVYSCDSSNRLPVFVNDIWQCSPFICDEDKKCATAECINGEAQPDGISYDLSPFTGKDTSTICNTGICDAIAYENLGRCGKPPHCPTAFEVYEQNGNCYQDVCPPDSIEDADGKCMVK